MSKHLSQVRERLGAEIRILAKQVELLEERNPGLSSFIKCLRAHGTEMERMLSALSAHEEEVRELVEVLKIALPEISVLLGDEYLSRTRDALRPFQGEKE